jgi:hypothetical protein
MPRFKFLGFATGSAVALAVAQGAASANAALTWGQPGGGGAPNASFTITRVDGLDNTNLIAPAGVHLRASSLVGFNVSEPPGDTNVYDPTQHRITFIWDFGDPGYVPRFTPNIPTVHRDPNIAYGKSVSHVFAAAGNYTVTCWAFDDAGNWGTATYTFGPSGNAGPIRSQNEAFPNNQTIVFSVDAATNPALWAGEPSGAVRCTTPTQVNSAVSAAGSRARVLFRRGEVYTFARNFGSTSGIGRDGGTSIYFSSYGPSSTPPVLNVDGSGPIKMQDVFGGACALDGLDFIGPWDAATETGTIGSPFSELGDNAENLVIHRCLISGMRWIQRGNNPTVGGGCSWWNDMRLTNWKDYGVLSFRGRTALIGSDFAQNVDALMGIDQLVYGSQSLTNFGNTHGPVRSAGERHLYVGCTSFFSRNGWSTASSGGAPTSSQACWRATPDTTVTTYRTHMMFDRCSFEGSGSLYSVQSVTDPASTGYERNRVFDKCLFVGTAYGADGAGNGFFNTRCPGMTIRNCYFYRPDVAKRQNDNLFQNGAVNADLTAGSPASLTDTPLRFYNNTFYIPSVQARIGTLAPVFFKTNGTVENQNNVFFAPNLTTPIGASFAPLGTSPLAGFQCRFKGGRWNPPPIGSDKGPTGLLPVTSRRENPGVPGTLQAGSVAVGESILLPYPNYTGQAGYTLNVTQAMILGNPTQRHQFSVHDVVIRRSDPALWPQGEGGVTISFQPTFIRVTNNTGVVWSTGDAWLQLDLTPQLMAFDTPSPPDIPAPVPGVGSGARVAPNPAAKAYDHFFGEIQNLNLDKFGNPVSRPNVIGAFAA